MLRDLVMQAEELNDDGMILPADVESAMIEAIRNVIAPFRKRLPEAIKPPLRLARKGVKRAIALASSPAAFAVQKARHVWQARKRKRWADRTGLSALIADGRPGLKGLGSYLSFETDEIDDLIWKTSLAGVECLPQACEPVVPEDLGSERMRELLDKASERFDVVIIDSPPILPYADAEMLAQWSDGVIFTAQSRVCPASTL